MKRVLAVLLAIAGLLSAPAAKAQTVHSSVTEFFTSLQAEPVDTIEAKVFALIDLSASEGADTQSTIAGLAFDFFSVSPVMGVEKVAIDVAKKYFLSGLLPWKGSSPLVQLESYVGFNEASQVGCDAPELWMESLTGEWVSLRGLTSGRTVLFFYSAQCVTCRRQAQDLALFASSYKGEPLTMVTVYTESTRAEWESFVAEYFATIENPAVTFVHLWDPEVLTDFPKKYGVLTTPQLYLIDRQRKIIGRRLSPESLGQMVQGELTVDRQYKALFDRIFNSLRPFEEGDAASVVDAMAQKTLPEAGADSSLFRESMQALFQYLRFSDEAELADGALYLAENYIVGRPEFWAPEFVDRIGRQLMQQKLNPVDSKATQLVLRDKKGRIKNLYDLRFRTFHIILFHLVGCDDCRKAVDELSALRREIENCDADVTLVYVGSDSESWKKFIKESPKGWRYLCDPDGSSRMRELYDLEYVPHLYLLDDEGVVIAKDIKTDILKTLLWHFSH